MPTQYATAMEIKVTTQETVTKEHTALSATKMEIWQEDAKQRKTASLVVQKMVKYLSSWAT